MSLLYVGDNAKNVWMELYIDLCTKLYDITVRLRRL